MWARLAPAAPARGREIREKSRDSRLQFESEKPKSRAPTPTHLTRAKRQKYPFISVLTTHHMVSWSWTLSREMLAPLRTWINARMHAHDRPPSWPNPSVALSTSTSGACTPCSLMILMSHTMIQKCHVRYKSAAAVLCPIESPALSACVLEPWASHHAPRDHAHATRLSAGPRHIAPPRS